MSENLVNIAISEQQCQKTPQILSSLHAFVQKCQKEKLQKNVTFLATLLENLANIAISESQRQTTL